MTISKRFFFKCDVYEVAFNILRERSGMAYLDASS